MSVIERRLLEEATAFVCGCSFIISGCPHHIHFYLLSYAMNAFHHISFHFFSFHFISFHSFSVIHMARLSHPFQLALVCAQCLSVSFHELNAQSCCCIYFDSKIKVSASALLCSIASYAHRAFSGYKRNGNICIASVICMLCKHCVRVCVQACGCMSVEERVRETPAPITSEIRNHSMYRVSKRQNAIEWNNNHVS